MVQATTELENGVSLKNAAGGPVTAPYGTPIWDRGTMRLQDF